ncbi:adenosylcobinamide-phosphate synthase CbiB [Candidatus Lokiarchaeum ossiferum]|uniref:adenosylcobinamide-phosphate synthase CbiB n=1 Tax=Candidatus Lokiarchaeum ossiferum TaxID=2951803 RepID=UPI00352CE499
MELLLIQDVYITFISLTAIWAIIIDLIIGDPNFKFHPVMLIGKSISFFKSKLRTGNQKRDKLNGILLIFIVILIFCSISIGIQIGVWKFWNFQNIDPNYAPKFWELGIITFLLGFLLKWTFAIKNLGDVTKPIQNFLENDALEQAQEKLSWIVRRNTKILDEQHIISASVEVIAESSTDAVTSVFWFYFMGGLLGFILSILTNGSFFLFLPIGFAYLYRIINTGDSVVGYKDEENINIGWFSAKSDDVANFIPTRLTVMCMFIIGFLMKLNISNAKFILKRDARTLESMNAGWTMGLMAGLLDVQLEKPGSYILGDKNRDLKPADIFLSYKCTRLSMLLFIILFGLISLLIIWGLSLYAN